MDILHYWDAAHPGLVQPVVGGDPVFSRPTAGAWRDRSGRLRRALPMFPRTQWAPLTGGVVVPTLLLEGASTNLLTESGSLLTWGTTGTPVVTGGHADPAGGIGAVLVEDTRVTGTGTVDGLNRWYMAAPVGAYVVHAFARRGSSPVAVLRMRDTLNGVNVDVSLAWATGVVTHSGNSGHITNVVAGTPSVWADGWHRIWVAFTTTAVGDLRVTLCGSDGPGVGSTFWWRPGVEGGATPSSDIVTAATTVARGADLLHWRFPHAPQEMSVYGSWIEAGTARAGNNIRLWSIGPTGSASSSFLVDASAAGRYRVQHRNGSGASATATLSAFAPESGQAAELVARLHADGSVSADLQVGAATTTASAAALPPAASWGDPWLYLNSAGTANHGRGLFRVLKAAKGLHTLDAMRHYRLDAAGNRI